MKLTTKIISIISIVLFICFISFTYVFISINSEKLKSEIDKDSQTISMFISSFSIEPLIIEDYPTIQTHINSLYSKFDNILCIEIYHKDLKVIGNECNKIENIDFRKYTSEISTKSIGNIGYVNLYLKDNANEIIKQRIINIFIFFSILYLLILISVSITIKRVLLNRIDKISSYSKQIANGNYDVNLEFKKNDELDSLANDLNSMSNMILSKQKSLNESQKIAKLGSWMIDYVNAVIFWSDETYEICNLDKNEILKIQTLSNLIHKEDQSSFKQLMSSNNDENIYEGRFRLNQNHNLKYVYLRWSNEFNSNNQKIKSTGIIQDITEKVLLEKKEAEHEAVLNHQQRLIHKAEILDTVGHHWRQPLNQISLASQMIELIDEENLSDDSKKNLNDIRNITKELSSTIDDFKNFFSNEKIVKNILLDELINDTLNLISLQVEKNNISIKKNFDKEYIYNIELCVTEFSNVLLGIFINAVEALEKIEGDKIIDISLKQNDRNDIVLTISDNAEPINEEDLPYIFDPYFSTKHEKNGTGLGLYMAKNVITNSLNGNIEAINTSNGVSFRITLPNTSKI